MSTVPYGVPNAIVDTGTLAASEPWTASATDRPVVLSPSDNSTMCAGGGACGVPGPRLATSKALMACSDVNTASPIAVRLSSCNWSIAAITATRSADGAATTLAAPAKLTTPTLNRTGRFRMNVRAADLAASKRLGATSVAFIDNDTSIATMIGARSRGTFTDAAGRAHPMIITMIA